MFDIKNIEVERAGEDYVLESGIALSSEQRRAVDEILDADPYDVQVVVLTGGAGTGKSTVVDYLREKHALPVVATTGRAAVNIGGITLDRLFMMSRDNYSKPFCGLGKFMLAMRELPDTIIIDEASMIGADMFRFLYDFPIMSANKQLILVGDWGQASPVKDEWVTKAPEWNACNVKKVFLRENHRQDGDQEFNALLNRLRVGKLTFEDHGVLGKRVAPPPTHEDLREGRRCCMFGSNAKAAEVNSELIRQLLAEGRPGIVINAELVSVSGRKLKPHQEATMRAHSPMAVDTTLALGCRVMVTHNQNEIGIVNGDVGVLVDIIDNEGVKLSEDQKEFDYGSQLRFIVDIHRKRGSDTEVSAGCEIPRNTYEIKDANDRGLYRILGYPLRPAYAFTVHKVQGQTLDSVYVDISSLKCFRKEGRHGLAYVALSRVKSLDGLTLNAWEPPVVYTDPWILPMITEDPAELDAGGTQKG